MLETLRGRAARVPDWAWLAADRHRLGARPRVARARECRRRSSSSTSSSTGSSRGASRRTATYSVRDVPTSGYSLLYPALLAPAHWVTDALPSAYGLAKALNALVMSLAAVPAWLLARRVAGARARASRRRARGRASVARVHGDARDREPLLSRSRSSFAWTLVRVLERPTWARLRRPRRSRSRPPSPPARRRSGSSPRSCVAPLCLALDRPRSRRLLRPFAPLYGVVAGLAVLVVGAQLARGQSLADASRRLQRRRRRRLRRRVRAALLALARRGADALRRRRPRGRARRASRPRSAPAGAPAGAPRRDRRARPHLDRRRRVRSPAASRPTACRIATSSSARRSCSSSFSAGSRSARRDRVVPLAVGERARRSCSSPRFRTTRFIGEPAKSDTFGPDPALDGQRAPPRRLLPGHGARRRRWRWSRWSRSSRPPGCVAVPARPARALRRPLTPGLVRPARRAPLR